MIVRKWIYPAVQVFLIIAYCLLCKNWKKHVCNYTSVTIVLCFFKTYTYSKHPWTDFNPCLMEPFLYIFLSHVSYVVPKDVLVRDWFLWSEDAHWNPGEYAEIKKKSGLLNRYQCLFELPTPYFQWLNKINNDFEQCMIHKSVWVSILTPTNIKGFLCQCINIYVNDCKMNF